MQKVDLATFAREDAFTLIGKEWMLVTAGTAEKFNTMTASWGGIGWLWNRPVAFVFIRPARYTHELVEQNDRLTLSFYDKAQRPALTLCGTKSGRDMDKVAAAGLTPQALESGAMTFAEARLTLDCRKLFKSSMLPENFVDKSVLERWYEKVSGGLHDVYVAEIENVYAK